MISTEPIRETVIDKPELERDRSTRAILNRNRSDYLARRSLRYYHRQREVEFNDLKKQVEKLTKVVESLISKK